MNKELPDCGYDRARAYGERKRSGKEHWVILETPLAVNDCMYIILAEKSEAEEPAVFTAYMYRLLWYSSSLSANSDCTFDSSHQ